MYAEVGDELLVRGRHLGDEDREGMIIEIHGENGAPPYLVRWKDGHETVFTPPPTRTWSTALPLSVPAA